MPSIIVAALVLFSNSAHADIISYNGDVHPSFEGWGVLSFGTPDIRIDNGILFQSFDAPGDQEFYNRSISEFANPSPFFTEWRIQTNVPSSTLATLDVRAALVLYGNTGVSYHFRFTDAEALFTRSDNSLLFTSLDPGVFHTYRIELLDDNTYNYLIDGIVVDSGEQPGLFPTSASQITWGARYFAPSQTTQWDYIRYGSIPEPATATLLLLGTTFLTLHRKSRTH